MISISATIEVGRYVKQDITITCLIEPEKKSHEVEDEIAIFLAAVRDIAYQDRVFYRDAEKIDSKMAEVVVV